MIADRDSLPKADWCLGNSAKYEEYAQSFGTPFYLYDADLLRARAAAVRAVFQDTVSVYFAIKSNPNLELLKRIRRGVDGLDVSSWGELEQALRAGYSPEALSFAGPAKTVGELFRAVECGASSISVESLRELRDLVGVARELGRSAHILLRINPAADPRAFGLKMGGRPLQFGIDEEGLDEALDLIADHKAELCLEGLHVYAGSQGFEHAAMAASYRYTLDLARRAEKRIGAEMTKINLGGGFGVSHADTGKALNLAALADAVVADFRAFQMGRRKRCRLIFELGRFLAADAGIYVVRVTGIKESRGRRFVITDGGLHHHLAAAGNFGAGFRSNYPVVNLSRPSAESAAYDIAGPSCNPTDLLGKDVDLPAAREGDLLAVRSAGSYGLTASPILFLGRDTPAELVRDNGWTVLGRRRWRMADFN